MNTPPPGYIPPTLDAVRAIARERIKREVDPLLDALDEIGDDMDDDMDDGHSAR